MSFIMTVSSALPLDNLSEKLARAARYIAGRQCQSGGFCVYRNVYLEEPNLSDTWLALAGLRLLGVDLPRPHEVSGWLDSFHVALLHHSALHDWIFSKQLLDAAWTPDPQLRQRIAALPLLPPQQEDAAWSPLKELIRVARLKATFARIEGAAEVVTWLQGLRHNGYGSKPNLQDTALALDLLALLGAPDETEETRAFVDALQSPYLGFNNTLDSRHCRLETLLAGVQCCAHLGLPVKHGAVIVSTVFAAQRGDGAFADVPGSLATLDSHYNALVLINMLMPLHLPKPQRP
jgi:hypothetical protein